MVRPALEQVARELTGTVKLVKIDVDATPNISQRFSVHAVPTDPGRPCQSPAPLPCRGCARHAPGAPSWDK